MKSYCRSLAAIALLCFTWRAFAFLPPANPRLPDFERRTGQPAPQTMVPSEKSAALLGLHASLPNATIDFDRVSGAPAFISAPGGFLSGPDGSGPGIEAPALAAIPVTDSNRVTKAFIQQ